jgi:hypothetical protein
VLGGGGWAAAVVDGAQVGEAGQVEGDLLAVGGVGDLELQGSGARGRDRGLDDSGDPDGLARAERDRLLDDPVIVEAAGIPAPGQHLEQAGYEGASTPCCPAGSASQAFCAAVAARGPATATPGPASPTPAGHPRPAPAPAFPAAESSPTKCASRDRPNGSRRASLSVLASTARPASGGASRLTEMATGPSGSVTMAPNSASTVVAPQPGGTSTRTTREAGGPGACSTARSAYRCSSLVLCASWRGGQLAWTGPCGAAGGAGDRRSRPRRGTGLGPGRSRPGRHPAD